MPRQYTIQRDILVNMRDGVALATDVYVPEGQGQFPTLLQRTPYDKSEPFGTQYIVGMNTLEALDDGFAVVIQDTRGRYGSQGAFTPFANEGKDGVDTLRWIREQDFSDGRVASYGASYGGATQMLLAMHGADGHVAMAPFLTSGDYREPWTYRGGALQLAFLLLWVAEALGPVDVEKRGLAADHLARQALAEMLGDPQAMLRNLPVLTEGRRELAPYLNDWLGHPTAQPFWSAITPLERISDIRTPALHMAGFHDIFLEGGLRSFQALRQHGATQEVRDGQYLIIGPWSHGNIGDWQGDTWLGHAAAAAVVNLTALQLTFFGAVLNGREPDLPRVSYFTTGVNQWRTADQWPPAGDTTALFLASAGMLSAVPEDDSGQDQYVSDPLDPVPTAGGASFLPGLLMGKNSGPKDQADVEARDDVLVYRSQSLDQSLQVAGNVTLELWASSSAEDCDWTGRLVDVDADGRALGITDGILRARYRHGDQAAALKPDQVECFTVDLGNTSHVFAAGHRVGLQVASSNFPRFDRNPQCLVVPVTATAADMVPARQSVMRGGTHASRLLLPVVRQED